MSRSEGASQVELDQLASLTQDPVATGDYHSASRGFRWWPPMLVLSSIGSCGAGMSVANDSLWPIFLLAAPVLCFFGVGFLAGDLRLPRRRPGEKAESVVKAYLLGIAQRRHPFAYSCLAPSVRRPQSAFEDLASFRQYAKTLSGLGGMYHYAMRVNDVRIVDDTSADGNVVKARVELLLVRVFAPVAYLGVPLALVGLVLLAQGVQLSAWLVLGIVLIGYWRAWRHEIRTGTIRLARGADDRWYLLDGRVVTEQQESAVEQQFLVGVCRIYPGLSN